MKRRGFFWSLVAAWLGMQVEVESEPTIANAPEGKYSVNGEDNYALWIDGGVAQYDSHVIINKGVCHVRRIGHTGKSSHSL